ncbi:hypothetical protein Bca101_044986 [Brassica carinata]
MVTMSLTFLFHYFILVSLFLSNFASSQTLPKGEVDALRAVATALKKSFSVDPCDVTSSEVTCSCTSKVCHVISIDLRAQNLQGSLPKELGRLTYLREILLSSNNLTGTIPDFIQNWTELQKLAIQASGLVGPIPSAIGTLVKLTDLRISDLNGPSSPFPPLQNMTSMKTLILRNSNLTGELPAYLGHIRTLKLLDLSFNKLSGPVPATYKNLLNVENVYFTSNMLSGEVPKWMVDKADMIDLSYNNFSKDPITKQCQKKEANLFSSTGPLVANNYSNVYCLSSNMCPKTLYGLHINCGGDELTINGTKYEADDTDSNYFESRTGWVSNNTGSFLDDERHLKVPTIWTNTSELKIPDPSLYTYARLSAISLTYYAFCLGDGRYTVNLHFAEIMFGDNETYSSLGRRLFDIYVQGKLEVKDFDIVSEAKGAGRAVVKSFQAIVTNGRLEIRFYWAGKGSQAIPVGGSYGVLVSAVSVDFSGGGPIGIIVGAVVASLVFLGILIVAILWWRGCLRTKSQMEKDFKKLDFETSSFSLKTIKEATDNFGPTNKLGEGGFGPVHKGKLKNGTMIAVKQLSSTSKQGNKEFLNEIGIISALQHPNLVKFGYMSPEYAMRGHLTDKADVYSFGVVALEIVHGRSNRRARSEADTYYLLDWVHDLREQNKLMEVVDPRLRTDYNRDEAMKMIQIGILCTSRVPSDRPSMSTVVSMLEGHSTVDVEELLETSFSRENQKDEESVRAMIDTWLGDDESDGC